MWKHFLTNTLRFSWEGVCEKEYFHAFCLRSLACFRVKTKDSVYQNITLENHTLEFGLYTEVYHHTQSLAIDQWSKTGWYKYGLRMSNLGSWKSQIIVSYIAYLVFVARSVCHAGRDAGSFKSSVLVGILAKLNGRMNESSAVNNGCKDHNI